MVKSTWLNNKIAKTNKEEMEKYFMIALDCSLKKQIRNSKAKNKIHEYQLPNDPKHKFTNDWMEMDKRTVGYTTKLFKLCVVCRFQEFVEFSKKLPVDLHKKCSIESFGKLMFLCIVKEKKEQA